MSEANDCEKNKINAIGLCVIKAILAVPYSRGRTSNLKTVSVDLPCSKKVFAERFACSSNAVQYGGEELFKCSVNPSELDNVFGENWHIFMYRNSSTVRRIFGLVFIFFRRKVTFIEVNTVSEMSR